MPLRAYLDRVPAWVQDLVLALVVTLLHVQGTLARAAADEETVLRPLGDLGGLGPTLLAVGGLVLALRRRFPTAVFVVAAAASLVYYTLDFPDGPGWVGLFVAAYTLTAHGDGRRSVVVAGVGIAVLSVAWLTAATDLEPRAAIGWVFFRIGAATMSAALGESVRSRGVITAEALERAELAERSREEEARTRVAQERLRIAREVHDTVAHAIAVINVQAGVTAHVLDRRPDRARETLVAIEQTSSRALQEMRTIVGMLRDGDRGPAPSLAEADDLLAQARRAGLEVHLASSSPSRALPSAVDAAAYRVLQEAITNVIRHVGPTRVHVELEYGAEQLEVALRDEGRRAVGTGGTVVGAGGAVTGSTGQGRGLLGMRERCELLGGRLDVGPLPDVGFEVRARFPLPPVAAVRA